MCKDILAGPHLSKWTITQYSKVRLTNLLTGFRVSRAFLLRQAGRKGAQTQFFG